MRGRRSIFGTAMRTAVVAGAVSRARGAGKPPPATSPPASAEPPAPGQAPASATTQDRSERLKQLAELRDSGILTDAEFEAAKQRVLSS